MLREHAMYPHHCFVLACCLGAALPAPASDLFAPAELSDRSFPSCAGATCCRGGSSASG